MNFPEVLPSEDFHTKHLGIIFLVYGQKQQKTIENFIGIHLERCNSFWDSNEDATRFNELLIKRNHLKEHVVRLYLMQETDNGGEVELKNLSGMKVSLHLLDYIVVHNDQLLQTTNYLLPMTVIKKILNADKYIGDGWRVIQLG